MTVDREVLASVFASRCQLAKKTLDEVVAEATREWERTLRWVDVNSRADGSFLWYCEEFDLDPSAVRRAIKEKAK